MSGFDINPDGDVYSQARLKLCGFVWYLIASKNVPADREDCKSIAAAIAAEMEPGDLASIVHGPAERLIDRIKWQANNQLDWMGAVNVARIFAGASHLALSDAELCDVAGSVFDRLKADNPINPEIRVWPLPEELAAIARDMVAEHGPSRNAVELANAIVPAPPPAPADPVASPVPGAAAGAPASKSAEAPLGDPA